MSPRRGDPKQKEPSGGGVPTWVIALGIGILVVVAAIALFTLQTPQAPAPVTSSGGGSTSNTRTKGDPNAKLEMIDWSDFQ
jgi:hypothetical protein